MRMPIPEGGFTHAQLIAWMVEFQLGALGIYAGVFYLIVRGLKKRTSVLIDDIRRVQTAVSSLKIEKLDVVLYVDDKEKVRTIIDQLQTRKDCNFMQAVCMASIKPKLEDISSDLTRVLVNQEELVGVKGTLEMVSDGLVKVTDRIDKHINGHGHKG